MARLVRRAARERRAGSRALATPALWSDAAHAAAVWSGTWVAARNATLVPRTVTIAGANASFAARALSLDGGRAPMTSRSPGLGAIEPPPAPRPDRRAAREQWTLPAGGRVLLVFGGSLGARGGSSRSSSNFPTWNLATSSILTASNCAWATIARDAGCLARVGLL